jgi:hypothetical protein
MGPPQAGGGIGTLGLVGPWAGYRVFKKKRGKETIIKCSSMYKINLSYGEGKSWYKSWSYRRGQDFKSWASCKCKVM